MKKTIEEINEKIKKGKAVVVTAEELINLIEEKGVKKTASRVDVVTTGTFAPMCSSGVMLNFKNVISHLKAGGGKVLLNKVPAYAGFAAADVFLGATSLPDNDPKNRFYPGEFNYGGGHVIEDLINGKEIELEMSTYGTDCYPEKYHKGKFCLNELTNAVMYNPRNCYQNYNVAVNLTDKFIYTYMGPLKPAMGNANYCSAGQLSPLLKDPYYKTIGIGTKIFLGGGYGYIVWQGTQHNQNVSRKENGIPEGPAGTIAVMGDLKQMNSKFIKGVSIMGYGVSLAVGIGIPIPIIDEESCCSAGIKDEEIYAPIIDYGKDYPYGEGKKIGEVSYKELRSGKIRFMGKDIPTGSLSSYAGAKEITLILKERILQKNFLLTQPVAKL